jgi:hypothetical protein
MKMVAGANLASCALTLSEIVHVLYKIKVHGWINTGTDTASVRYDLAIDLWRKGKLLLNTESN